MNNRKATYAGILLTVAVHAILLMFGFRSQLQKMDVPPSVQGMLIEFPPEEEPVPIRTAVGVEPRAEEADPVEEVRLVQKAEAPVAADVAENTGVETTIGDEGDVEVPEPPADRALFSSRRSNRTDTAAVQVASEISDRLTAGHPKGNTEEGSPDGRPTARLEGRTVMGNLPLPEYSVQNAGTVVVRIMVDQYGTVTSAVPGARGTTVQDATLWEAARKAALKAKFNVSASAPAVQEGTITYVKPSSTSPPPHPPSRKARSHTCSPCGKHAAIPACVRASVLPHCIPPSGGQSPFATTAPFHPTFRRCAVSPRFPHTFRR